jgi:hypothetical protein
LASAGNQSATGRAPRTADDKDQQSVNAKKLLKKRQTRVFDRIMSPLADYDSRSAAFGIVARRSAALGSVLEDGNS